MDYSNETYLNGKDIWITYNARLIHDSFTNLLLPESMKEYTENKMRSAPGKQIFISNPQSDEKEGQISFKIECQNRIDFLKKYKQLVVELKKGLIELKIIPIQTTYKLTIESYVSLDSYSDGGAGILVVKYNEPNPEDQESTLITANVLSTPDSKLLINNSEEILTSKIK